MIGAEREEWERARVGDRAALDALLRRHEKSIFRFGLRMCGDEDAAKEVLQRTLLSAFEQFASFRGESSISTWLYTLARTQCGRLRRRGRSAPVHDLELDAAADAPELVSPTPTPHESSSRAEMTELVSAAIGLLSPSQREAVVLKDVEELSLEEAARITGLALPAFKSRLHRAREQLRANLATLLHDHAEDRMVAACPKLHDTLLSVPEEIDRAACQLIEQHLAECDDCRDRLGPLRDAASLCRRLPSGDVPMPVQRAVRTALLGALKRP